MAIQTIPFTKDVPPYIAAVEPTKIAADRADRRFELYGSFPTVSDGRVPSVIVDGQTLPLSKAAGKWTFDLPANVKLTEENFVNFDVVVPIRTGWFGLWKGEERIRDRIYVQNSKPLACAISIYVFNPDLGSVYLT